MAYEIIEKLPSMEEYNRLRWLVNWSVYEPEIIVRALPQSLYCVCALSGADIVGMARVLGDGCLVFYIQDGIVHPNHQRQGIGAQMMERVMAYISSHASQNLIIGLMSASGKEPFYEKDGFVKRPTDRLGCGMTIFWQTSPSNQTVKGKSK